ncbi:hypothetical protein FRB93_010405 [Tulasnella sp. JGI-2019a]|nr:hypothetical protein FRB93_010405 [Tulasnella sp. JGI-2019a]
MSLDYEQPTSSRLTSEFWRRYDKLAEKCDQDLSNLNADVNIISFLAGLISIVNIKLIALTHSTPSPADQTNLLVQQLVAGLSHNIPRLSELNFTPGTAFVRPNRVFIASSFCSLLAMTGALLVKLWLLQYPRTSLFERQGERSMRGPAGAELRGLQFVMEWFLVLFELSIPLSFIASPDYVYTTNSAAVLPGYA